jgi:hypothetical protein
MVKPLIIKVVKKVYNIPFVRRTITYISGFAGVIEVAEFTSAFNVSQPLYPRITAGFRGTCCTGALIITSYLSQRIPLAVI